VSAQERAWLEAIWLQVVLDQIAEES